MKNQTIQMIYILYGKEEKQTCFNYNENLMCSFMVLLLKLLRRQRLETTPHPKDDNLLRIAYKLFEYEC